MKKALLKACFTVCVLVLTIAFMLPASFLLDAVLPTGHDEHGRLRHIDGLFPGIVAIFACLTLANRITSFLFWSAHLSDQRWSILETRRSRRGT
jgi:hypothetical protein